MLRIHLTPQDVTRLSFAAKPHLELGASVRALSRPGWREGTERWRRRVLPRLPRESWPLLDLVTVQGHAPRVLTDEPDVAQNPAASRLLVEACRAFENSCLSPVRDAVRSCVDTELVRVGQSLLSDGAVGALDGLRPDISFDGTVLQVDGDYALTDIHLDGRGLRLIPTYFWQRPGFSDEGVDCPVFVYPIARPQPAQSSGMDETALEKLLGRNRARVLRATVSGVGTGDLARMVGISPASASEHLAVLRDAGLVVTQRAGKSVRHYPTALGAAVVG